MISPSVPPEQTRPSRLLLVVIAFLALLLLPAAPVLAAPGTTPPGTPPGAGQPEDTGKAKPEAPPVWVAPRDQRGPRQLRLPVARGP